MTNPAIKRLLREAVEEERQYKLCLLEDIIKAKKCLYGFGFIEHDEFITENGRNALFNNLWDLDVVSLEVALKSYGNTLTNAARKRVAELKEV
jgi:hypothetical protein